ncbi:MAG: hypothetical protein JXA90_13170, partial [Planctomycetes bacterium]|nr:hypothetical protein [Planctomycetota bacterium]
MNRVFLTCLLLAAFSGAPLCADPGEISGRTGRAEDAGVADRPERSGPQAGGDLPEIAGPSDLPALPALPPPTSEPSIAAWAGADPAKLRSGWKPMAGSMPVVARAVSGRDVLEMPCNFRSTEIERASWDLEVGLDLAAARGLELLFYSPDPSPVSHFSLYFRSGGGWYAATFHPGSAEGWSRIAIDRESARVEGRPAGWGSVDAIRISAWRGSDADTRFYVADLAVRGAAAPVAVIRADAPAAAGREGAREIDTYCARVARYLGECGVAHVVIRDSDVNAKRLGPRKVAILPYNPSMSAAAAEALVSFVERGGKVVAFYHLPAALLPAVGLEAGEYVRQDRPGRFAEIRPLAGAPSGFPARVRQRSWNIQELRAVEGRSRAVAVWHDAEGESTGRAAVLLSPAGAFMTHVLLDDDEAAQRALLLSLVGHFHAGALAEALEYAVERAGRFGPYQGVREALGEIGRVAAESAGARERLERVRGRLGKARAMGAAGERIPEALDLAGEVRSELIDLYCSLQKPLAGEHRAFWCHSAFGVEG